MIDRVQITFWTVLPKIAVVQFGRLMMVLGHFVRFFLAVATTCVCVFGDCVGYWRFQGRARPGKNTRGGTQKSQRSEAAR